MAVHMFRVLAHDPPDVSESEVQRGVQTWVSNNTPWTANPVPHEVNLVDDPLSDAPLHYRGDFRFEDTDDADALRKEIAQTLTHYCDWWRVGYHRCSHDEDNAESCSWDEQYESGTVPSEMPTNTN